MHSPNKRRQFGISNQFPSLEISFIVAIPNVLFEFHYKQINLCFIANLVNRDFNRIPDRITFYTNTTACILARTRCSLINPITADVQRQKSVIPPIGITNAVGTAGYYHYNALQIARNGEIKIIGLPSAWVLGNTFCTHNISLDQSPYNAQVCPFS